VTKKLEALFAIAGVALLVFVAGKIGWGSVFRALEQARFAVATVFVLSFVRLVLQTRAWSIALRSDGVRTSTGELMLIRLAAQGLGYLSVLGPLASEPMKISLLRRARGSATTATLVDTGVYWFASGMVGFAGCVAAITLMSHSRHSIASLLIVGLILAGFLFLLQRPKLRVAPRADAFGSRCPRWLRKGGQIEIAIRKFEADYPSSVRRMFLLDVACQALLAAEVVAILWCLHVPFHTMTVLGIEGASRAIKIAAGWMPARIGADESGFAAAFFALGLSPASGLTLALARRSRDLFGALIGLSWLALSSGIWKFPAVTGEATCKPS
jgi:hypothetical protein